MSHGPPLERSANTMALQPALVEDAIASLTKFSNAVPPKSFPTDPVVAKNAGMYSWWADDDAKSVLGRVLGCELPDLIYVGLAGATKWPSGTLSSATLLKRIRTQHIRGNAKSSTFRLTLSALLLDELELAPAVAGRLDSRSNSVVSTWISDHLRVAITPWGDRNSLSELEAHVVKRLNPPLNLDHCAPTSQRAILKKLRARIARS